MRGLMQINTHGVSMCFNQVQRRSKYHARLLDHYNNPRNVGALNKNDTDVGRVFESPKANRRLSKL